MTISPPVDIIVIMTNISQNTGVFSISRGAYVCAVAPSTAAGRHCLTSALAAGAGQRGENADRAEDDAEHINERCARSRPTCIVASIGNVVSIAPKP